MKEYTDSEKESLISGFTYQRDELEEIIQNVNLLINGLSSEVQSLADDFYHGEIYGAQVGLSMLYRRVSRGLEGECYLYQDGKFEYNGGVLRKEAAILEIARFADMWNYDPISTDITGPNEKCKNLAYLIFKAASEQPKLFRNFLVTNVTEDKLTLRKFSISEMEDDEVKRWKK